MQIQGSTVLITGANRGIGKAIAESFLAAGAAKVYATARKPESVQPLVDAYGDRVVPLALDLSKPETITAAAKAAPDANIVVNNGGVLTVSPALAQDAIEKFQYEIDINVYGLIRVAQAFAPVLKANGGGALVQLNSVASVKNFSGFATYSASKAASYSITQGLKEQLEEQGTRVISVHPGPIDTDMAHDAGFKGDPPGVVADGIIEALRNGEFHVFPDTMARQFWDAYQGFAKAIVEPVMTEA